MKSYTDLKQSEKLAKILPIESADMHCSTWTILENGEFIVSPNQGSTIEDLQEDYGNQIIPCWSLAALLDILPILERKGYKKTKPQLFYIVHINKWIVDSHVYTTDAYDNPIDACVEMILKLKEKDLI